MARGLLKKLGLATSAVLLATTLNAQSPQKNTIQEDTRPVLYIGNDNFGVRPMLTFGMLEGYGGRPIKKVFDVPEIIRHVPIHPDDYYADEKNNGPIEPDDIKGASLIDLFTPTVGGGLEFKLGEAYLDLTVNTDMPFFGNICARALPYPDYKPDKLYNSYRRNYTNHSGTSTRGYGAALTMYTTAISPIVIPQLSGELFIPVNLILKNEEGHLLMGYSVRKYTLNMETGWDRYDSYEKNERFPIADILENSVYGGWGYLDDESSSGVKLGVNFYDIKRIDPKGVDPGGEMKFESRKWSPFVMIYGKLKF
ncbi:MAG: hypothetical protein ACP5OA_06125 [Candidatus Woesearchaeota archaeon]